VSFADVTAWKSFGASGLAAYGFIIPPNAWNAGE
jgi:hypothetical protein